MVSATPSGGWLQSSPVIPALGWPLGTRAQMFWLEEGLASSLRRGTRPGRRSPPASRCATASRGSPGARPAATSRSSGRCTSSSATSSSGMNLQEAIDAPEFHTDHLISSFYPRGFEHRSLAVEGRFGEDVVGGLRAARPRRDGLAGLVARPGQRGRAGSRRDAEGRREPARRCRATPSAAETS